MKMAVPEGWKRRGLGHIAQSRKFASERHILARLDASSLVLPPAAPGVENGKLVPIDDQGGAGTCWPFSIRRVIRNGMTGPGPSVAPGLAVRPLYRRICEAQQQIADNGTDPSVGIATLDKWGFTKDSEDPYTDNLAELLAPIPADVAVSSWDERDPDGLDWAWLDAPTSGANLDLLDRVLSSGRLVSCCWEVSNSFCDGSFDPSVPLDPPEGDIAGGHAMAISGYRIDPVYGKVYIVDDEWSTSFGLAGRVLFTPAYIAAGSSLVTLAKPPAIVW